MSDLGKQVRPRAEDIERYSSPRRYSRMVRNIALTISLVTVTPLLILTWFNYREYRLLTETPRIGPATELLERARDSIHDLFAVRRSVLELAIKNVAAPDLVDAERLAVLHAELDQAIGGYADLGIADAEGNVLAYSGPDPRPQDSVASRGWFRNVEGHHAHAENRGPVADPTFRFLVTVPWTDPEGHPQVIWAGIDERLVRRALESQGWASVELHLTDREKNRITSAPLAESLIGGVAEAESTNSLPEIEEPIPAGESAPAPPPSPEAGVWRVALEGEPGLALGCARIGHTPFTLWLLDRPPAPSTWIFQPRDLLFFSGGSVLLIVVVVVWGSRRTGHRLRKSDLRRAALYHHLEYSNKMATIGRLGAGVAHEINNPLAIIGEKAGLVRDILTLSDAPPSKEKILKQVDAIQYSIERCAKITHRLLGFAKHVEVKPEKIDLRELVSEVLGFLDKEASYRSIRVANEIPVSLPGIVSDRGQLEQVFLNIINNAFDAVADGGSIGLTGEEKEDGTGLVIYIEDDGVGISEENLKHVFEPFFTTKAGSGTGLGLSITYGVVEKLGGKLGVRSKAGEGTRFAVELPLLEA